jgi:hypothetical protein
MRQPHVSRGPYLRRYLPPERQAERIRWGDVIALGGCLLVAVAFVLLWVGR